MRETNTVCARGEYSINAKSLSREGGRTKGFTGIKKHLRDLCALCGDKKYFARMWQDFTTR